MVSYINDTKKYHLGIVMRNHLFRGSLIGLISAGAAIADTITAVPSETLDWVETPEGVAFADLHGERFVESYMSMVRLPAGTISPPHTKSANMYGVMISGMMTHVATDSSGPAAPLGAGAFYRIPADLPHVSSCISDEPCVTFLYQDGAFDFVPVDQ